MDRRYIPSVKLKNIYLGEVDGKKEASKDNFLDYFYKEHPVVKKSQQNDIYFIFGKKGTGKTILAYYLKKQYEDRGYISKITDVHDFEMKYLTEECQSNFEFDSYYLFWKWNILLHISEAIIEDKKFTKMIPVSKAGRLNSIIKNRYKTSKGYKSRGYRKSLSYGSGISMAAGIFNGGSGKVSGQYANGMEVDYKKTFFYDEIKVLEKRVKSILKQKPKFLIMYDDIDELRVAADGNGSLNMKLVEKIFSAIKDVNIMINRVTKNNGSKVMLFFRNDLKELLNAGSNNLNRVVSDSQAVLDWHYNLDRRPYEDPLMDLILNKIQHSNPMLRDISKKDIYENYFSSKVDGINVVRYLKRHSFGKPRDFIKYLNIIKEAYPEKDKFVSHIFKRCEREFSEYFFNELLNEIAISEKGEFVKESITLIRNYKKPSFSYEEINRYYMENIESYKNIRSCKEALSFLYKKGVLGNSWIYKRNKRGKEIYHFSWAYRNDSSPEPNYTQMFTVHKAIHKKFSMYDY